ncbi:hypothetical protein ACLMJK_008541 [Lecanora helva]
MATAEVLFPPSNRVLPGSLLLPTAPLPSSIPQSNDSLGSVASDWVSSFNQVLDGAIEKISDLFVSESCWRDLLCMSWDFRTLQGPQKISSFVKDVSQDRRIVKISLDTSTSHRSPQICGFGHLKVIRAFLKLETSCGRGSGLIRLIASGNGGLWKALALFTKLEELKGHEEIISSRRPTGFEGTQEVGGLNWEDMRTAQRNFDGGREPIVLIVGAGQGGLSAAARLKQLGLETLIVDRNPRIGDNWRKRYHQLVLHDSVWYDHMPYLNFPPNWPVFTPKDKLADWFEYYAGVLELNVWTSTNLESPEWSEDRQQWTVTLAREKDGRIERRVLHPHHVILATGHSGEPYLPSDIAGINDFKGDRLVHSAYFTHPNKNAKGKKAVIVGCCNSGHDIARDYYNHGYNVTMVQRSSTLVADSQTLIDVTMKDLYEEGGPPVEDADIINLSTANKLGKNVQIADTTEIMRRDGPLLKGLTAAGFKVDSGPDGSGLWMKYLHRGGGYYIDVGASQLIVDKKIKVKQGQEIKAIKAHSLLFADDSELEADEIVFATGYQNMRETARRIFGNDLADRVHDVWGFDEEGETRGMWRRSGHPGFWFFGGNLALCRFYSKLLALQIKAIELGLLKA